MASDLTAWKGQIKAASTRFAKLVNGADPLKYEEEAMYAMQMISRNEKLLQAAVQNPQSAQMALLNVAAVGLSLNPATKLAYLVPRDGEIYLDVSYMGLIRIATDTGSIKWARAEIVYEQDDFTYNGPVSMPDHHTHPFIDRGNKIGCYCIAKTADDEIMVEVMSADDVAAVRKASKGSGSGYSPWNTFEGEMWKKTVIKRASKTWPKSDRSGRLEKAVHVVNEHEGLREEYDTVEAGVVIDHMKMMELATVVKEVIDDDDEISTPERLHEIDNSLTNDERIALAGKLKAMQFRDTRKTYASVYNSWLKYEPATTDEIRGTVA